ncbi:MAG: hypothetical protein ACRDRD_14610 [Pseudonocardiaceae bacterium]
MLRTDPTPGCYADSGREDSQRRYAPSANGWELANGAELAELARAAEQRRIRWAAALADDADAWLAERSHGPECCSAEHALAGVTVADLIAPSLDELAGQWLDRWAAAGREEREQMAAATLTDELKAAIRRLSAARKIKGGVQ